MKTLSAPLNVANDIVSYQEVDAKIVMVWLEAGEILLVDVRETSEYEQEHIAGSVLCPLSVFDPELFPRIPDKLVVLHCAIGKRSAAAAKQLINHGHSRIVNLKGGLKAWKELGGATESQLIDPKEIKKLTQLRESTPDKQDGYLFSLPKYRSFRSSGIHPGLILLEEFLSPLGLSQTRLAKELNIPISRIHSIIKGRISINADTALRLSRYFCTTEEFWLHLQVTHDLEKARKALGVEIKSRIQPHKN